MINLSGCTPKRSTARYLYPLDKAFAAWYNIKNIIYADLKGEIVMLAVNYSTIKDNLNDYCAKAAEEDETVIVTRENEKNIVIMSLEQYNGIMKALKNMEYLAKLDRAFKQLEAGKGQLHEIDDNI